MRAEVMWFAHQMQKKLDQRMAYKTGWLRTSNRVLMGRLLEEAVELVEALQKTHRADISIDDIRGAFEEVIKESCDVGNFAMMIADKARLVLG